MNITLSIIYLLVSFLLTILCYKKYGKIGMYIWMCLGVIISNIQTIKMASLFGLTVSLGNISYGTVFLTTDILSEIYGEKSTKEAIKISFLVMIVFTLFMWLFLQYEPSTIDTSQKALETVFGYIPRITLGSMCAYYLSQTCDAKIYAFLKKRTSKIWLRNNISTFISQTINTIIFLTISFAGLMSFTSLVELFLTMLLFKILIAVLDTPFIYLAKRLKNVQEIK